MQRLPMQVDPALAASCTYRARFSMECGSLALDVRAGELGSLEASLKLWRLEAVEHIPAAAGDLAVSAATLQEVCFCCDLCPL